MKKIVLITNSSQLSLFPSEYLTIENSLDSLITYIEEQYTKEVATLGVDTETVYNSKKEQIVWTAQFGNEDMQFVVDCRTVDISPLKPYLEDKKLLKLFQNFKFDWWYFKTQFNIDITHVFDTFIAECLITNGYKNRELNLAVIGKKYANVYISKDDRGKINYEGLSDDVVIYAAKDVEYLKTIYIAQANILKKRAMFKYAMLESADARIFSNMEGVGIAFNTEKWIANTEKNKIKVSILEKELDKILITDLPSYNKGIQLDAFQPPKRLTKVNWNSPDQVRKIFNSYGLQLVSVAEQFVLPHKKVPIVKKYLEYKEVQTLVSKFGTKYLEHVKNNRVYFSIWQILDTFRVAMREPNISQIPQDNNIRNCFEAAKGCKFVDCDFASQELALIADDSKDPVWLQATNNGWDLHSITAELVYKSKWEEGTLPTCAYYHQVYISEDGKHIIPVSNYNNEEGYHLYGNKQKCTCPNHKHLRNAIKSVNYGVAYGIGPNKLSSMLDITVEEAKQILKMYFETFPTLREYFKGLQEYGIKKLHMATFPPFNAIRFFDKPSNKQEYAEIQRQSTNTRIQATGANILKLALYLVQQEVDKAPYYVRIVMSIHDSIVCEVDEAHAEEWAAIQVAAMKKASDSVTRLVKVGVDCQITDYWMK